jgi:hypothetical protein
MENADYACSTKSSHSVAHGIECDPDERPTKLLYTGPAGAGESLNMYNLGRFQIASQGMSTAGTNLGELWVSYDITFYKKQISKAVSITSQSWQRSITWSAALPLGSANVTRYGDFQLIPVVGFNGRYQIPTGVPLGYYQCIWYLDAASGMSLANSLVAVSGCTVVSAQITQPPFAGPGGNGTTTSLAIIGLNVTAPNAQFTAVSSTPVTVNSNIFQMSLENSAWVQTA